MVKSSASQRLIGVFLQEARERTGSMESDLLRLEKGGDQEATEEECVRNVLRSAHSLKGAARLVEQQSIESVCHWMEELLTRSQTGSVPVESRHIQLLLEATDAIAQALPLLERGNEPPSDPLEEVSAGLMAASGELAGATAGSEAYKSATSRDSIPFHSSSVEKTLRRTDAAPSSDAIDVEPFIRVSSGRLDAMLAHSGELLLVRTAALNRVTQLSKVREIIRRDRTKSANRELDLELQLLLSAMTADYRSLKRISAGLDTEVRDARLQPFSWACEGLDRLVRDLAAAAGKQARLQIEGGQIEIDRSILEELRTAIRHIVRNAVDHGIETADERAKADKVAEGRVLVSASLQQDRIAIRISDDGRGLPKDRIRDSAIQYGLNGQAADEDVEQLIFLPGLSTASTTTRVSGRGIGLDAVRNSVESMRGAIQVDYAEGEGTTFTITVPLTVGSMRALLVRCGGQLFAIDSSAVRKVFRFSSDMISTSGAGRLFVRSDEPLPLVRLADWFQIERERDAGAEKRLVGIELTEVGRGAAIEVGEIVAEQEFLIRSLGPRLTNIADFSGAVVMPDGGIALVLNVAAVGLAALSGGVSPLVHGEIKAREKRHRILIVDDSITTRTLEKTILEGAGYEVSVAADGAEAWQVLGDEGTDLILADVDMPGMDGFMLTEKVRQSAQFRDLPVILLTARESAEDRQRGLSLGADAYLVKSAFDQRELLSTIGQLL